MFLMTLGAVILFDVVATLGGGAFATLGLGAATLGAGGSSGACRLAKMAVKSWIALMCLIFSMVVVGTAAPRALMSSVAVEMERSCCEVTEIWLWAGYRHHVMEKRKGRVAGM
jgi:hypothetical protein